MNNLIFTISGMGGCGKSTFIDFCKKENNNVVELSTVDFVKEIAVLCGWNGEKEEIDRKFLSDLKDLLDKRYNLSRVKIDEFISSVDNKIIFINAREGADIDYFKEKYNAITILIKNNRIKPILTNHADRDTENYWFDITIENNGTLEEWEERARALIREIK